MRTKGDVYRNNIFNSSGVYKMKKNFKTGIKSKK